jgi:hypothetical protein
MSEVQTLIDTESGGGDYVVLRVFFPRRYLEASEPFVAAREARVAGSMLQNVISVLKDQHQGCDE